MRVKKRKTASRRIARQARRGVMLLIVTLVLTTLALSGAALLTLMKTENEATSTRGRESLVKGVDRSAVVFLIGTLQMSRQEREQMGGLYDNPQYFCGAQLLSMTEGGADTSRFTVLSPKITDSEIEGVRYGLVDESTRLNLEAVLQWDRESPGAGRQALMKLPGMTQIAADSILDWIDPDERQRQFGAEARYYSDKKLPYSPRNATPVFLEELLLARGVTRSQLYGSDENFTYNVDKIKDSGASNALGGSLLSVPTANANSGVAVPWKELITVFSAEKDVDPTGAARVDLNVDNLQFLYQELASRVGEDLAKFAVLYRQYGAAESAEGTGEAGGSAGGARGRGRASGYARDAGATGARGRRSGYFASPQADATPDGATPGVLSQATLNFSTPGATTLASPLDLVGARVVVDGVAYSSPIADSQATENVEKLFTLLDYCSTNSTTTIIGRVNVNGAPRAVLSALPGLAPSDVDRIMQRRPDITKAVPSDYRHASWLYTKGLVGLAQMKSLYNKTTAQGDVYRGQIVGFLERSDETSRAEVVVDGSTEPPRQVFYKDLTTLGKGFSDVVLLGGASVGEATTLNDGNVDWGAVTNVFEIENAGSRSGYLSQGTGASSSAGSGGTGALNDPFAALDAATGTSSEGTGASGGLLGADLTAGLGGATTTLSSSTQPDVGLGLGGLGGTSGATSESSPQGEGVGEAGTAATDDNASRRRRLLDALRSSREARSARNQSLGGGSTQAEASPDNSAPNASQPDSNAGGGGAETTPSSRRTNSAGGAAASDDGSEDRTTRALNALRGARGG